MKSNYLHSNVTSLIIRGFFNVYNKLGYGFLEKVYENALLIELKNLNLRCHSQCSIDVLYQNHRVGHYIADIVVNDCVIIEIKANEHLLEENEYQLINYLKATHIEVGMLLNFGKTPEFKRKVFSSDYKSKPNEIVK